MRNITVLGIGNRLMKDDGIGVNIVEHLMEQNNMENFSFEIGETDLDYCISIIDQAAFLIIIDAFFSGKQPGEITFLRLHETSGVLKGISPHHQTPFKYINTFCKDLQGFFIGIEPFEIVYNFGLSSILEQRLSTILAEIIILLNKTKINILENEWIE